MSAVGLVGPEPEGRAGLGPGAAGHGHRPQSGLGLRLEAGGSRCGREEGLRSALDQSRCLGDQLGHPERQRMEVALQTMTRPRLRGALRWPGRDSLTGVRAQAPPVAQAGTSQLRCPQVTGAGTGVCWVPGLTPQGTSFPRGWLASREAPWQPLQTGQGGDTLHPGLPCTDATGDRSIRAPLPDDRLGLPDSVSRGEAGDTPGSKEARVQRDPRAVVPGHRCCHLELQPRVAVGSGHARRCPQF